MTAPTGQWVDAGVDVAQVQRGFMAAASRLPTLFSLEEEAYRLMTLLEEADDKRLSLREAGFVAEDVETELSSQLALVDQMLMEKTESYVSVIRSLEAMSTARKVEADRLRDRARSAENHAEWLKNRLLVHMQTTGRDRIETSRFTLTVRQNNPSVTVLDAAAIPSEFTRTTITVAPDKVAILAAHKKDGEVVPGTTIERNSRLAIQ